MQNLAAAVFCGAVGPLAAFLWHDEVTREPNALVLSLLASATAMRLAPRARYAATLLATFAVVAVSVSTYVAGELFIRRLGAPPLWLPDRGWLVLWGTALAAFALAARYSTVAARARRVRVRRTSTLVAS